MASRLVVVLVASILLAAAVLRNAAASAFIERSPAEAVRIWPYYPDAELALGMRQIAEAARDHRDVPGSAFELMRDAFGKAPLAPEPYLVRGIQAQLSGDDRTAQMAFEAAQWRDPRSLPAAYFLADRYFRTGDAPRGLAQIAALARLTPNGLTTIGPYLAVYARDPRNWPALRQLFRQNRSLAQVTLTALASNVATVPAVVALADPREAVGQSEWLEPLLNTLISAGQYERAWKIWSQATRPPANELVHDASFSDQQSPSPFNWSLTASAVGLAERQPGGRLHLLFYGQEDGLLASQLLVLEPGSYRLSMRLLGDAAKARALNWSIWCDKAPAPLGSITLDAAASRTWQFQVPAGCRAQWLRLSGSSIDMPQQVDVTIAALKLARIVAGG